MTVVFGLLGAVLSSLYSNVLAKLSSENKTLHPNNKNINAVRYSVDGRDSYAAIPSSHANVLGICLPSWVFHIPNHTGDNRTCMLSCIPHWRTYFDGVPAYWWPNLWICFGNIFELYRALYNPLLFEEKQKSRVLLVGRYTQ